VELAEEILSQLAAFGFAAYLNQPVQKEVYNDWLINHFITGGHALNAGPLYRWAANMIMEAEGENVNHLHPFFWQEEDGKLVLNKNIHHLATLRNEVMHGFFVLPPERNHEEAGKIADILQTLLDEKVFILLCAQAP